jgi:hypothetical protein
MDHLDIGTIVYLDDNDKVTNKRWVHNAPRCGKCKKFCKTIDYLSLCCNTPLLGSQPVAGILMDVQDGEAKVAVHGGMYSNLYS